MEFATALIRWAGNSDARLYDAYGLLDRIEAEILADRLAPHATFERPRYSASSGASNSTTAVWIERFTSAYVGKIRASARHLRTVRTYPLRALQGFVLLALLGTGLFWAVVTTCYPHFNTRPSDLLVIQRALEKYHAEHGVYPATGPEDGRQVFFGIGWNSNDPNWIPGLVPRYLDRLPIDPRKSNIPNAQYIYASNGAAYKLLAMEPEDCKFAVLVRPWLRDPVRSALRGACIAYGIYTRGAEHF